MKIILFIILLLLSLSLNAQDIDENTDNFIENDIENIDVDYNKTGIILSLSAFDYFSIGIGYNIGSWGRAGHHFFGSNYGILIAYKTLNELYLRIYGNVYGGASAMYMGVSATLCTNFDEITGGLSPEIGIGFPGISIFYRYNFYFYNWEKYNCHEIVLLIYPLNKIFNKK